MTSLLSDLLDWLGFKRGAPIIPNPPAPPELHPDMHLIVPPTPVADLPVSCLVQGIVKSLETEREKWIMTNTYDSGVSCGTSWLKHTDTKLCIYWLWDYEDDRGLRFPSYTSSNVTFNRRERDLVDTAINAKHKHDAAVANAKWDAENAALNRHFEDLGCPPPTLKPVQNGEHYVVVSKPKRRKPRRA